MNNQFFLEPPFSYLRLGFASFCGPQRGRMHFHITRGMRDRKKNENCSSIFSPPPLTFFLVNNAGALRHDLFETRGSSSNIFSPGNLLWHLACLISISRASSCNFPPPPTELNQEAASFGEAALKRNPSPPPPPLLPLPSTKMFRPLLVHDFYADADCHSLPFPSSRGSQYPVISWEGRKEWKGEERRGGPFRKLGSLVIRIYWLNFSSNHLLAPSDANLVGITSCTPLLLPLPPPPPPPPAEGRIQSRGHPHKSLFGEEEETRKTAQHES